MACRRYPRQNTRQLLRVVSSAFQNRTSISKNNLKINKPLLQSGAQKLSCGLKLEIEEKLYNYKLETATFVDRVSRFELQLRKDSDLS